MKRIKEILVFLTILITTIPLTDLFAGSSQADGERYYQLDEIAKFAKKVERELAKRGARVALVARVGRDRSDLPAGINFTHVGFAVYSKITTGDGRDIFGYTMYNLYQRTGELDKSDLIEDFPVDFFAGVQVLEAGIVIPTPELQKRLLAVLTSPTYRELHRPAYSVIANPFTTEFQNCTEFALNVITAAIYQTDNKEVIKANLQKYFHPHKLDINPFKLMLGSVLAADVTTTDHPDSIVTATYTTISSFLSKYSLTDEIFVIKPDAHPENAETEKPITSAERPAGSNNRVGQEYRSAVTDLICTLDSLQGGWS